MRRAFAHQIDAVRPVTGAGLEIGGESITHAGGKEAGGSRRYDGCVGDHHIRVLGQEQIALELARRVVDHREGGTGGIGGGNGGKQHHGAAQVEGHSLGDIQGLAAADADDNVGSLLLGQIAQAADLDVGAFVVELLDRPLQTCLQQAGQRLLPHSLHNELVADEQGVVAEIFYVIMELGQQIVADDELFGGGDGTRQDRHAVFLKAVSGIRLVCKRVFLPHHTPRLP